MPNTGPEPLIAWRHVGPVDVLILNELSRGTPQTAISQAVEARFGIKLTRTDIENHIRQLEDAAILKRDAVVVDISKLYNHVMLVALKFSVPSVLVRGVKVVTWGEMLSVLKEKLQDFNQLHLLMAFTPQGEGEYDVFLIICTNNLAQYAAFQNDLMRHGLIEKSRTQPVHMPHGFYFNPLIMPSFEEVKEASDFYRERLALFHKGEESSKRKKEGE